MQPGRRACLGRTTLESNDPSITSNYQRFQQIGRSAFRSKPGSSFRTSLRDFRLDVPDYVEEIAMVPPIGKGRPRSLSGEAQQWTLCFDHPRSFFSAAVRRNMVCPTASRPMRMTVP
jgi:hypothetical protein